MLIVFHLSGNYLLSTSAAAVFFVVGIFLCSFFLRDQVIDHELNRLSALEVSSAEFNICRTYLEWLTQLPWGMTSIDNEEIDRASVRQRCNRCMSIFLVETLHFVWDAGDS